MKVKMDIIKIFLTPPKTMFERTVLFIFLVVTFVVFFGPLRFSAMSPLEAMFTAAFPSVSISWGLIVLLRSIFRKRDFCKMDE